MPQGKILLSHSLPRSSQFVFRVLLTLVLAQPGGLLAFEIPFHSGTSSWLPKRTLDPKTLLKVDVRTPLAFEENKGQTDPSVRFLAREKGYNLFLTPAEAVFTFYPDSRSKRSGRAEILRLRILGGNRLCRMEGEAPAPGRSNYFKGQDPDHWIQGVRHYAKVAMKGVYPGIDMVYYGERGRLEYDLVVNPGADPGSIALSYGGARNVRIDRKGALVLRMEGGDVVFQAPSIYQPTGGTKVLVKGRYRMGKDKRIGFAVEGYDRTRPLVIDPVLAYATYLGGSGLDYGLAITADGAGNAYVTGQTNSANFPVVPGSFQTTKAGGYDAYVSKINPSGTALVYSTFLGGSLDDGGQALAVDAAGNVYVTGAAESANFPVTPGVFQPAKGGFRNVFVTKLNPSGSALLYSTFLGGNQNDIGNAIAVDGAGNAYVAGYVTSKNFPITPGAFQSALGGFDNGFVTKINPSASAILYSTFLGGSNGDYCAGIAVDGGGNAYVTGSTASANFPVTPGVFQPVLSGYGDVFVTKIDPTGTALLYSTFLGGTGQETSGSQIAVDGAGDAYVAGTTTSSNFPVTPGAFQTIFGGGGDDAFVTKLNPTGTALVYSTYLGGSGADAANGIAVDPSGNAYLTGLAGANFPITAGALQTAPMGIYDAFISKLDPTGSTLLYSTYYGGSGTGGYPDESWGIALDPQGDVYVVGQTRSTDFPATAGAFQTTLGGTQTAFGSVANAFALKLAFVTPTPTPFSACQSDLFVGLNLFNPQDGQAPLTVRATLCYPESYSVVIFNSAGEHIRTLANSAGQPAGSLQMTWDGKNKYGDKVASGVYLIRMAADDGAHVARVLVVR